MYRDCLVIAVLRCLRVCVCVCGWMVAGWCNVSVSVRADRGHFSFSLHCYPPSLFSHSPLFLCAGILLKQIGANRLCHCMTQGSPNRKRTSHKREEKANREGVHGEIKEKEKTSELEERKQDGTKKRDWVRRGREREVDGQTERKKQRRRERSDNLKLNSHHVSVEQNSIVFIGSP